MAWLRYLLQIAATSWTGWQEGVMVQEVVRLDLHKLSVISTIAYKMCRIVQFMYGIWLCVQSVSRHMWVCI